jgi:hypothetical protein
MSLLAGTRLGPYEVLAKLTPRVQGGEVERCVWAPDGRRLVLDAPRREVA